MKTTRGFTLVEVILVLFIFSVGIGGVFVFISSSTKSSSLVSNKLTASYLAQEGTEIVRNIRDTNFLDIASGGASGWDDELTGCGGAGCEADYDDTALTAWSDSFLNISGGDRYSYAAGTATIFKRRITVTGADPVRSVVVDVFWTERGITHRVISETQLYDWIQ